MARCQTLGRDRRRGAGMGREQDGLFQAGQAVEDAGQPVGPDVCLTVDRGQHVAPRFEPEVRERGRSLQRGRCKLEARVVHDVADDLDPAGNAFAAKRVGAALVGAEEDVGNAVDLDPVVLLGHREVAAPESRLDVRDRRTRRDGGLRPGQGRVRVAEDEDRVGSFGAGPFLEELAHPIDIGRSQVEVDRFHEAELVEEHL